MVRVYEMKSGSQPRPLPVAANHLIALHTNRDDQPNISQDQRYFNSSGQASASLPMILNKGLASGSN